MWESQASRHHPLGPGGAYPKPAIPGPAAGGAAGAHVHSGASRGELESCWLPWPHLASSVSDNPRHCGSLINTSKREHVLEGPLASGTSRFFWLSWARAALAKGRWGTAGQCVLGEACPLRPCSCSGNTSSSSALITLGEGPPPSEHMSEESSAASPRTPPGSPADNRGGSARKMSIGDIAPGNQSFALQKPLPSEAIGLLEEGAVWMRGTRSGPPPSDTPPRHGRSVMTGHTGVCIPRKDTSGEEARHSRKS